MTRGSMYTHEVDEHSVHVPTDFHPSPTNTVIVTHCPGNFVTVVTG